MKELTGTTNQFIVKSQYKDENTLYCPGVYSSVSLNDALPGRPVFIVYCEGIKFVANDLNEALQCWADNGRLVVKAVTRVA